MSGKMRILTNLVVIAIVAVALGIFIIRGPGPLDFAGGTKVALADYRAGKPTGVPANSQPYLTFCTNLPLSRLDMAP